MDSNGQMFSVIEFSYGKINNMEYNPKHREKIYENMKYKTVSNMIVEYSSFQYINKKHSTREIFKRLKILCPLTQQLGQLRIL